MLKKETVKKQKKFIAPHTYVLVVAIIILAAIMTYLIPAGKYDTMMSPSGKEVIDPDSFTFIEQNPASIGDILLSIPEGMAKAQATIFLVFLVGGFSYVVTETGAIDASINLALDKLGDKALLAIPVTMIILAILGGTSVVVDGVVAFIPIGMILAKKLNLDPIVAVGMLYLGSHLGFGSSPICPFTVLIAQEIAELPLLSGFTFRSIVYVVLTIVTTIYVYRYAVKIRKNPSESIMGDFKWNEEDGVSDVQTKEFKKSYAIVILALIIGFIIYGYGTYKYQWGLSHLSATLIAIGVISGIAVGMGLNEIAETFVRGAQNMVFGALIIGFAAAISVVLEKGNIIHSIVYYLTIPLALVPKIFSAVGMFIFNLIFNFIVPSGSGQAMIVMPLMAPMADIVGITRQTAVTAFQYGDGFSNIIIPTSGSLMACLGLAKISYNKWFKFVLPIFLIWVLIGSTAVIIATLIGLA